MWSPWRSKYIKGFKNKSKNKSECFICEAINDLEHDEENLIVARYDKVVIMMNRYPYNCGHLLVTTKKHTGDFLMLDEQELAELNIVNQKCIQALTNIYKPEGFNLGVNLGENSGAGLPTHIHYHVLPRWNGDTNFTSTIADIKVVPFAMEETYEKVYKELKKIG